MKIPATSHAEKKVIKNVYYIRKETWIYGITLFNPKKVYINLLNTFVLSKKMDIHDQSEYGVSFCLLDM